MDFPLPDSLQGNKITVMESRGNELYCGTDGGLVLRFQVPLRKFTEVIFKNDFAISSIFVHEDSTLYVGTSGGGVGVLNRGALQFWNTSNGLTDDYIHDIVANDPFIFVATDLGLCQINRSSPNGNKTTLNSSKGLSDNLILSLHPDSENQCIWMGMQNGTFSSWNLVSQEIKTTHPLGGKSLAIVEVFEYDNHIGILNETGEIALLNKSTLDQIMWVSAPVDIPDTDAHAIITSEGKMLRVGANKAPEMLSLNLIEWPSLHPWAVSCIYVDAAGFIWTATQDALYRQKKNELHLEPQRVFTFPNKQFKIVSMSEGLLGDLWFGTYGSGLGKVDGQNLKTTLYKEQDGLMNNNVLSIAIHGNNMWLATLGGACSFSLTDEKPQFQTDIGTAELGTNFIYQVVADAAGRLYFATDGNGIVMLNKGIFTPLITRLPLLGKTITQVAVDRHGHLLALSSDKGLQWTDLEKVIDFSTEKNLGGSAEILNITMSRMGDFLIATSSGFYTLDSDNLSIHHISSGFELDADYLNVLSRDPEGIMWFANSNAILSIRESAKKYIRHPIVYIDQVDVMFEPIDTTEHVFSASDNHFTFHFGAIRLIDPESAVFQYQLEGFDEGWSTTLDGTVRYPHLRPGKYKFRIRCSRYDNWDTASEVVYSFQILSPIWQRWWFIVLISLAIAGIFYITVRLRFNALKRREMIARTAAQSKFETLRNQVNPHFLFNSFNTLNAIIQTDPNEAVAYVERLSDYFRLVLEQRDKEVIPIREEIELVQNYLLLQQTRFGDNLRIHLEMDAATMNYPIPPLTLQLLAENAIKHNVISKAKPLTITIERRENNIVVRNNLQPKINKEPSTGIGLDNVRERYRILFNQVITIEKTNDAFSVFLPLDSK